MKYIKIATSDGDTRWLNLHHISRVTLATDADKARMLAIFFQDAHPEAALRIHDTDAINQKAIDSVIEALDRQLIESMTPVSA